jgi:hypothetical protein
VALTGGYVQPDAIFHSDRGSTPPPNSSRSNSQDLWMKIF